VNGDPGDLNEARIHSADFEPATLGDIAALVAIDGQSPVPWTVGTFEDEVRRDPKTLFVLRSAGRVVAFVAARVQAQDVDIVNVAVDAAERQRGWGGLIVRRLLERAVEMGARTAFLEVRESNLAARRLYEGRGFHETQKRRSFYRDPVEDAVLMSREIGP